MLQQTQVVTVVDYFQRFIETFPTVRELAAADEQEVLRLWEGLGYYRRARQLHKAAKVVVDERDGQFPRDFDSVLALPGIGRYTAGAISSIAWDARQPIVEANTVRVFSRLLAYRDDPTSSAGQKLLWSFSEDLLPQRNTGLFNQALMELGSEICSPKLPACSECPVKTLCPTFDLGLQDEIPRPKKKMVYEEVNETAVVVRHKNAVLLRQCGPDERWAGLWDFPRFASPKSDDCLYESVDREVAELTGVKVETHADFTTIKHGVTRFRITLSCYEAKRVGGRLKNDQTRWVSVKELSEYPLSVTGRKIAKLLS